MSGLAAIGQGYAAYSNYTQGKTIRERAKAQAGIVRAGSQRDAELRRRQAALLQSRGLAVAAASGAGAGADDPTVVNQLADIEAQGEMNALNTLWEGEQESQDLLYRGDIAYREGRAKAVAGVMQIGSTMYEKYGGEITGKVREYFSERSKTRRRGTGTAIADYMNNPTLDNYA